MAISRSLDGFPALRAIAGLLTICIASSSIALAADNPVFISVPGSSIRLETFVYFPPGRGSTGQKNPVVIFSHGSSGGKPEISYPSQRMADYFVKRGFIFLAPMRRGRGQSSGESPEMELKNCDPDSWTPGLQLSTDDLSAVLEYVGQIPRADRTTVILTGTSRGGFLSVAYAARGKYRQNIVGVINFVGGWVAQARYQCVVDFNYLSFAKFGRETRTPMLWLYGTPDTFYADESIESYHEVFAANGGNVRFRSIYGVPKNGHWLPGYPALWAKYVDFFLMSLRKNESKRVIADADGPGLTQTRLFRR